MAEDFLLPEAHQLVQELEDLEKQEHPTKDDLLHLEELMNQLTEQHEIDPNFKGTIKEFSLFIEQGIESPDPKEHIHVHELHIKRWKQELGLLGKGSKAVTIDHEQRKGREI